jgi:type IV pilus assembly protein PilO
MALTMESISKLSPKKKFLILTGILVVLGGLYLYHFILPEIEKRKDMEIQLGKLQKELTESKAIERDLKNYKEQVERMNQELDRALQQLPNEKEIPELLKNVSSLGKNAQLEFVLFKPKPEEPQQFYARVPIELTMLGTYHNTGVFFDRVSKLPRIINVVDFNMARAKEAGKAREGADEVLIRTSCLVNTYRFIEKKSEDKKSEKKSEKK